MAPSTFPDFSYEVRAFEDGRKSVAGIDEAGRGPWAGPVVAAAVILNPDDIPEGLQDSKKLSAKRRDVVYDQIIAKATVGVACVSQLLIDKINIREATLRAMSEAAAALDKPADWCFIDGNAIPTPLIGRAEYVIKGDAKCLSIAAASIVAKVTRDRIMMEAARNYPGYGFEKHSGYGTAEHLTALQKLGPCAIHRMSFKPIKGLFAA